MEGVQGLFPPLLYVLALEPLLRRLRNERARTALRGIKLTGSVRAKISAFADGITVLMSSHLDILPVKIAVERYIKVAGAKINFDKREGLRLGAWKGSFPLPGPFHWSDGPTRIFEVWFGPELQLERNWLEVRVKVEAQVVTWLRRRLSLKGRVEMFAVNTFPLILYRLSVLPMHKYHRVSLERSLIKLLWKGASPIVRRQVCYQRPRDGGLGMPGLESHRLAERLPYQSRSLMTEAVWSLKVRVAFPRLRLNPKAEGHCRPRNGTPYVSECRRALRNLPRSSDLSRSRKELYRGLVLGSASDPLVKLLGWSVEEVCSHRNWAPGSGFLKNSEFSLTWRLSRNALSLNDWAYRACIADMPD